MNDTKPYIPRKIFTQYFTDIFIRNNKNALYEAVRIAALAKEKTLETIDIDRIIDAAVYAAIVEMYSNQMMNKQDSIADIIRRNLFTILNEE